jgi:two-component system, chemotaxis family, chemotaxis protein CheY
VSRLILLIDDNAFVRESLSWMLRRAGYAVISAEDGVRGVATFRQAQPALVITDISMPEKDGIETIREIRSLAPDVPILAMSGGGTDFLEPARRLGASCILAKPFEAKELLATVASCLEN